MLALTFMFFQVTLSGLLLKHKSKEEGHAVIIQQAQRGSFILSTVPVSLTYQEHILIIIWEFVYLLKDVYRIKEQLSSLQQRFDTQI